MPETMVRISGELNAGAGLGWGGVVVEMRERRLFLGKEHRFSDLSELKRCSVVTQVLDTQ